MLRDRLWLAPTWTRWLVQTTTYLVFAVPFLGWGYPRFVHRVGWPGSVAALVALCGWLAAAVLWAWQPVGARYRSVADGLSTPQAVAAARALRTGEVPKDPAVASAAIRLGALGRALRRGTPRWQATARRFSPLLIAVIAAGEYLLSLRRLAVSLAILAAVTAINQLLSARRMRRTRRNLDILRAAADLPADDGEVVPALPQPRARIFVAAALVPLVVFGAVLITVTRPRPDCRTASVVFTVIYDSRQLTEPQSVDWRSPDLAAYRAWSDRLHELSRQASNPAVVPHLRRIAELSTQAVSNVAAAQHDRDPQPAKTAYYNTIRQIVDEEYALEAYCD